MNIILTILIVISIIIFLFVLLFVFCALRLSSMISRTEEKRFGSNNSFD